MHTTSYLTDCPALANWVVVYLLSVYRDNALFELFAVRSFCSVRRPCIYSTRLLYVCTYYVKHFNEI